MQQLSIFSCLEYFQKTPSSWQFPLPKYNFGDKVVLNIGYTKSLIDFMSE